MIKVSQIKLPFQHTEEELKKAIMKKMRIQGNELVSYSILKQSLDARQSKKSGHAGSIVFQYTIAVELKNEKKYMKNNRQKDILIYQPVRYEFPCKASNRKGNAPVIIGSGPAGLFCGLMLAQQGFAPIVLERGSDVRQRVNDVEEYWEKGILNPESNVQFGEGGAGTFSDGKLNTLVKDPSGRHQKVLELFVEAGAPEDILYVQKPHIGTDLLVQVVENIRNEIIRLGGQVYFHSKVTDLIVDDTGCVRAVMVNQDRMIDTDCVVAAIGHSSRDTFEMFEKHHVYMEPKPFAIGVRIEHPQAMMNHSQYGVESDLLPAADYKLTYQTDSGRNVYTFCMCPGGYVVNASSEERRIAVNGMSNRKRDSRNANSAVIVNVTPDDFESGDPLAGMHFQRHWEELAYREGQGSVPVQLYGDFKKCKISTAFGEVQPEHKGKTVFANVRNCLPDYVGDSLVEGIEAFGSKIHGFNREDAIVSGVETRTSSPVRINRDECFQSNIKGLFPCGEGAGYAGGITSAAMDGLRVAEAVARYFEGEKNADYK